MKLSIGEVSRIFNISREALRFYDKIGILKPEINKDNGYRYYEFKHLEQLGLILGIKLLGISLSDIKDTIESEDLEEYKSLVQKQEEILQIKRNELLQLEYHLNKTKSVLDTVINFQNEYDFEKLNIVNQSKILCAVDTKIILSSNISKSYNLGSNVDDYSFSKEIDNECFYSYSIIDNATVKEIEDVVFVKDSPYNKFFLSECNSKDIGIVDKITIGKSVSVNFYGNIKDINEYILDMNRHFKCSDNNMAYIKYEFYLPRKSDDVCYFVNINLKIDN